RGHRSAGTRRQAGARLRTSRGGAPTHVLHGQRHALDGRLRGGQRETGVLATTRAGPGDRRVAVRRAVRAVRAGVLGGTIRGRPPPRGGDGRGRRRGGVDGLVGCLRPGDGRGARGAGRGGAISRSQDAGDDLIPGRYQGGGQGP